MIDIKNKGIEKIKIVDGNIIEYRILNLVDKYDSVLKTPTEPFNFDNPQIDPIVLANTLIESMSAYKGIGLSANQLGIPLSVFCMAMVEGSDYQNSNKLQAVCLFNPKIVNMSEITVMGKEGCLSYPKLFLPIRRSAEVDIDYYAHNGSKFQGRFKGIDARCAQHEIEHLEGKLFTDRVGSVSLIQAKRKAAKLQKKLKRM